MSHGLSQALQLFNRMSSLGSIRIARIRGVDLNVHLSLVFLLFYVVAVISLQFQDITTAAQLEPDQLAFGPLGWGITFALAVLASVTIHEFGHVFMAQRMGIHAPSITLMMLGGISSIEHSHEEAARSPYAEFKLSIIGPVVSLALAALFFFIESRTNSPNLSLFAYWVARANLTLGIFNLLPAFPLDGGRALRSLLSANRDFLGATRSAVRLSRAFAWVLGAFGLLTFNLLLILIAFFIHSAASNELSLVTAKSLIRGARVRDALIGLEPVRDWASLRHAAREMSRNRFPVLAVETENGTPAVLTLYKLKRIPEAQWDMARVRSAMEPVKSAPDADAPLDETLQLLSASPGNSLPVSEAGRVIGVIRLDEVLELIQLRTLNPDANARDRDEDRRRAA